MLKIQKFPTLPSEWHKSLPPSKQLLPHQQLIMTLLAEGWSTKEIASILNVATKTIEFHRVKLYSIFNINSIAILTRIAIKMGFVKD